MDGAWLRSLQDTAYGSVGSASTVGVKTLRKYSPVGCDIHCEVSALLAVHSQG